ncbi:MAG TPA: DoxX family protein [Kiritimatiellia bacterium]|nr:DoxX family protein [Kiritimatiellia bacterium]
MKEVTYSIGITILRVASGVMMATHGYGKIFGGRMEGFTEVVASLGFPVPGLFAWMAALSELVGGICLALGLGTRISAFFLAGTMFVAGFIRHASDPFARKELAFLYLSVMIFFVLAGGGRWALEKLIRCRK